MYCTDVFKVFKHQKVNLNLKYKNIQGKYSTTSVQLFLLFTTTYNTSDQCCS